ncbi:YhfG family protein [Pseudomonas sp. B21-035]|uniref:YhfG family protein n=1 Tax=Pseudomonas sp. B21-035 TaxID=2895484 RepID=UPI002160E6DA|nr:YhfG family protein [Pseudomonas sp. B21-035]UVL59006.1 YhfG family protein [Pseudomonas sp. B21-035]
MKTPSLQAKKAHCAKTRQSNYSASLRLEGFDVTPDDAERKLPTREAVLKAYRQQARG